MKTSSFILALLVMTTFMTVVFSAEIQPVTTHKPEINNASADNVICAVYFTGIGCPHCARADPVVLSELVNEYNDLVIIEYEIYQERDNAQLLYGYDSNYNSGLGFPLIIFSRDKHIIGDTPILKNVRKTIDNLSWNPCPLLNGSSVPFSQLDIASLPGKPKIWAKDRILIKTGEGGDNQLLKDLLETETPCSLLNNKSYETTDAKPAPLSGSSVKFDNAIKLKGWTFQWNGNGLENNGTGGNWTNDVNETDRSNKEETKKDLTLPKIVSLAAVDAVNPCALAVLTLMLISILTYNPKKKRNVLLAGLAFTISVFVMYLLYGLVIIRFFQFIQALAVIRLWLYKILGLLAVILGLLNLRDFFHYKPGRLGTEMPMMLRPKVKKIISRVTSPRGAFVVGLFVTVFLLPCTIGPYVIASGILSALELMKTIPWLLIYNSIFVLPMIAITLVVYAGIKKVEDVSGWKDKNIRYLHLVAGLIIFCLGIAMVMGWV